MLNMKSKPKIIVILGPTATGKSDLAVQVAQKFKGEVISADSRQVYKGLNIGSGKITKKEMRGVPHHLLDVVNPKKVFSVADWQALAKKKIEEIISRGHTPIICGGTGFYIQSIVDDLVLPEVPANNTLRKKLENKSTEELFQMLKKLDPKRAKNIDAQNPVRLVRAIEIATELGYVPKIKKEKPKYDFIQIGLTASPEVLKERIHKRLLARIKKGMVAEAKKLHGEGLSYKRMRKLGLEYGRLADLLAKTAPAVRPTQTKSGFRENKITKKEFVEKLDTEIYQYTRRQIAWFKRDKNIKWFDVSEKNILKEVLEFLFTINL
jgi:tRNA dimethylallyltransferase